MTVTIFLYLKHTDRIITQVPGYLQKTVWRSVLVSFNFIRSQISECSFRVNKVTKECAVVPLDTHKRKPVRLLHVRSITHIVGWSS